MSSLTPTQLVDYPISDESSDDAALSDDESVEGCISSDERDHWEGGDDDSEDEDPSDEDYEEEEEAGTQASGDFGRSGDSEEGDQGGSRITRDHRCEAAGGGRGEPLQRTMTAHQYQHQGILSAPRERERNPAHVHTTTTHSSHIHQSFGRKLAARLERAFDRISAKKGAGV